jgi:hypothetical protein
MKKNKASSVVIGGHPAGLMLSVITYRSNRAITRQVEVELLVYSVFLRS